MGHIVCVCVCKRLKGACGLCVCALFGWFGVGLSCKEVAICVHLIQEGRDVGGLMVV